MASSTVVAIRLDVRPGGLAIAVGVRARRAERRGASDGDAGDAATGNPSSIGIPAITAVGSTTGGITTRISTSAGSSGVGGSASAGVAAPGSANVMTGADRSGRWTCTFLSSASGVAGELANGGDASIAGSAGTATGAAHDHVQAQSHVQVSGVPAPAEVEVVLVSPQKSNVQIQLQGSPDALELVVPGLAGGLPTVLGAAELAVVPGPADVADPGFGGEFA
jgi:hypothetical protein